jgi:hypothetical protein
MRCAEAQSPIAIIARLHRRLRTWAPLHAGPRLTQGVEDRSPYPLANASILVKFLAKFELFR